MKNVVPGLGTRSIWVIFFALLAGLIEIYWTRNMSINSSSYQIPIQFCMQRNKSATGMTYILLRFRKQRKNGQQCWSQDEVTGNFALTRLEKIYSRSNSPPSSGLITEAFRCFDCNDSVFPGSWFGLDWLLIGFTGRWVRRKEPLISISDPNSLSSSPSFPVDPLLEVLLGVTSGNGVLFDLLVWFDSSSPSFFPFFDLHPLNAIPNKNQNNTKYNSSCSAFLRCKFSK